MINKIDTEKWINELDSKSSLAIYKQFKNNIKEKKIYTNDYQSIVLFRCRSNTIKLNWRRIFEGGDTTCALCNEEEETLEHFLIKCTVLDTV